MGSALFEDLIVVSPGVGGVVRARSKAPESIWRSSTTATEGERLVMNVIEAKWDARA
jgi:hypothetical protein